MIQIQFTTEAAAKAYDGQNYGSPDAAGFDLRAMIDEPITLDLEAQVMVPTGIKLNMMPFAKQASAPLKVAALAMPRSGRGAKDGLVLGNTLGLIDQDYLGEIMLCCWLRPIFGKYENVVINPGERIAQLVIVPVLRPDLMVVTKFSNETERGEGGFGSTGN